MGHKNESNQKANQTYNRNDLNRPKPTSLTNIYFFFCTRQTQVFFLRTEIRLDKKKTQSFHIPVVDRKVFLTKYFLVFYLISMSCPIA